MRTRHALIAMILVTAACTGEQANEGTSPDSTSTSTESQVEPTTIPPATPSSTAATPPEHRIRIRVVDGEGEFYDTETAETFVVQGTNYIFVQDPSGRWVSEPLDTFDYDPDQIRADFSRLAEAGFTTVRIFLDPCGNPPGCITQPGVPGLDGDYLDNVVDAISAAAETGIYLLITSNDIPDHGGYGDLANAGASSSIAGYRNAHYLTGPGHDAAVAYWGDVMEGLAERGARFDHVLAWSLLNEQWLFGEQPPLSLTEGLVTTADGATYDMADPDQKSEMVANNLNRYVERVVDTIKTTDPTALVTMGFFSPQFPNPTAIGGTWYVDTAGYLTGSAPLDFYDFHAYPGEDIPLDQIAENFGVQLSPDKPVVMGEYGPFKERFGEITTAARSISDWVVESCSLGFDGWIYWSYRSNPTVGDTTWGLTSEEGFLLDTLAPANRPDPCAPITIETNNLAFGAPVRASMSLPEEPPENAVDENETTQWGAGADAPQWIEIDVGDGVDVGRVRLLVAQYPEGDTTHRVLIDRGSGFEVVHEFNANTRPGDWLEFAPESPLQDVITVRIETRSSPSWVAWGEIEITGP